MKLKHVSRLAVIILIFSAVAFVYGTECSADDTLNRNQKDKGSEQKQTVHAVIQFDKLSHDFGTVVQGSEVKHSFVFKNRGNGILKIEKVKAGWGCTAALASASEIPPGGEGKVDVTFKAEGDKAGKIQKTVYVITNDPEHLRVSLKIRVKVQIILSLPRFVNFRRVMKGSQPVKYVSFIGRDKDNTKVVSVKSKQEFIKVDINPSGFENDKRKQIKITLKPGFKKGLFKENLTVYTDHKQIKQRQVTVVAKIVDNIEAKPKNLTFGPVKKGSRVERSIRVKALFDKAFKIVDVRASEPELETKVETVKDGKEYLIKVFLNEKFDRKLLEGKIIIETDDEDQRQIEIGAYGAMLDRSKN